MKLGFFHYKESIESVVISSSKSEEDARLHEVPSFQPFSLFLKSNRLRGIEHMMKLDSL